MAKQFAVYVDGGYFRVRVGGFPQNFFIGSKAVCCVTVASKLKPRKNTHSFQ